MKVNTRALTTTVIAFALGVLTGICVASWAILAAVPQ